MSYIRSNQIKVFPSSKRNDELDRNARLTSEQNLISLVNRLSKVDSFIVGEDSFTIEGIENNNLIISRGDCNIHGYYFKIEESQTIDISNAASSVTGYVYFQVKVKTETAVDTSFAELEGRDSEEGEFTGLNIAVKTSPINQAELESSGIYSLLISQKVGNLWQRPANSLLRFDASEIKVNNLNVGPPVLTTANETKSLQEFLISDLKNIIIDDGEI